MVINLDYSIGHGLTDFLILGKCNNLYLSTFSENDILVPKKKTMCTVYYIVDINKEVIAYSVTYRKLDEVINWKVI